MAYKKVVLEGDATVDIFAANSIQLSSESFADNDTSLMTSAAINDRIAAISSNTSGTVTSVGGTGSVSGLTLSGTVTSSGNLTLGGTLSVATGSIQDDAVTEAKLSVGNNPQDGYILGWNDANSTLKWVEQPTGDITGVTAGSGLSGGGTTGAVTLNIGAGALIDVSSTQVSVDLSELTDGTADIVGSEDELVYLDNGSQKRKLISEIKLSQFNNDSNFGTGSGDITAVVAGNGLTGGASSGSATLNVVGGTGVTVAADSVSIGQSVATTADVDFATVTTTGNVVVGGDLTVSGTTITTATETLEVADNTIILNSDLTGSAVDAGFVFERGSTGNNRTLFYDASADRFVTSTNSSAALGGSYHSDMTQTEVNSSFSNSSTKVPVGHFQWNGSNLYVRTS